MATEKEPLTWGEAIQICVDIKKKEAKRRDFVVEREAEIASAIGGTEDDGPDSLADHKQRLGTMSARLAAAESEVRRLRQAIESADTGFAVYIDGKFDSADADECLAGVSAGFADADGESVDCRRVKVAPTSVLEAINAD